MKIVAISDTHNYRIDLPKGDLLIVAGDLTARGSAAELREFNHFIEEESYKFKYKPLVIAGNHDFYLEEGLDRAEAILTSANYLEDKLIEIDGLKIYGSPWTPTFMNMAFMKDRGSEIEQAWHEIPDNIDILVTHGPPQGILDLCPSGNVGCEALLETLTNRLTAPPRIHIFGHIHEGYGSFSNEKTQFFNVAVCNVRYSPINAPTIIDI